MRTTIRVQAEPFDVAAELDALSRGGVGAVASFTGYVRQEDGLDALLLEHYPGMTEREIARHVEAAQTRWALLGITIIHRVGELRPSDPIVLVAAASAHRADAFRACEFLMDHLKHSATFWKRERRGGETRWIEAKASDDAAAKRWT